MSIINFSIYVCKIVEDVFGILALLEKNFKSLLKDALGSTRDGVEGQSNERFIKLKIEYNSLSD
jgi:hypothetical protein